MLAFNSLINRSSESEAARKRVKRLGKIGGLMAGGGLGFNLLYPLLLTSILDFFLVFEDGGLVTGMWQEVPIPLKTRLYFWNLDNPEEFQAGAKPRFTEKGPYTYTTYLSHDVVEWGDNGDSVTYYMRITWDFDEKDTVGSRSDSLTILNPIAFATGGLTSNILDKIPFSFTFRPIVFGFINAFLYTHGEGFLKETTVQDLVEGKYMTMLGTVDMLLKPLRWLNLDILKPLLELYETRVAQNKFGLLHAVNNTRIGPYTVNTGKSDPKKFGKFIKFHEQTIFSHWEKRSCNLFNGTEGLNFGHFLDKGDKQYLFFGELCRPIYVTYKGMSFERAIPISRYITPPAFFASPNKNPENKCFCNTPDDYDMCDGIFDIGPCYFGAPASVSLPHFLYANEKISSKVIGMRPDPDLHELYFDVNTALGSPVGARFRIQANLMVKPLPLLFGFGSLPETVYPFIWLELAIHVEGILAGLLGVGMYTLLILEWVPLLVGLGGLGVLGNASRVAYKERKVLFKPRDQTIPIEPNYAIDRQTQAKVQQLYPNLFTISGNGQQIPSNPPQYNNSQPPLTNQVRSGRPEPVPARRQLSPINGNDIESNQHRVSSPPGAVE